MPDRSEHTARELFDLSGRVALLAGASGHLGSHWQALLQKQDAAL